MHVFYYYASFSKKATYENNLVAVTYLGSIFPKFF